VLACLRIHELAIVPELEVPFGPGLVVVTGETGAGKSILVNALKLVLGERARPDLVRSGAEQAEVEALFHLDGDAAIRARLDANGIPGGDDLVIRRVVGANGRSRAYVNGRLVTASQLVAVATGLVDISSQHEHQSLVDAGSHLGWLDMFAGHGELLGTVASAHDALAGLVADVADARSRLSDRSAREDLLRFQLGEIEKIRPVPGEEAQLVEEISRLRHAERLVTACQGAEEALWSGEGAVAGRLARVAAQIGEAARFDRELEPFADRVEAARVELEEVGRELGRRSRGFDGDPARLGEIEDRLHGVRRLARKYGGSLEAALAFREEAARELSGLDDAEGKLESLEKSLERAREQAGEAAHRLSLRRREEAGRLGSAITAELDSLGMGGARVEVAVEPAQPGQGDLVVQGARLSRAGIDRVEFLIAPNRGEEPRPLRKVASGGELSRALLALKRVLAGLGPGGTYVFDEVDSGVGGAVAEAIGRKLRDVARHHQVVCITHLPQVAALGDLHLRVRKGDQDGRTVSSIARLSAKERVEEVARMMGGARVTDTTKKAARELLTSA
jgi:DNA repair protein RecN (Recombination protein N)